MRHCRHATRGIPTRTHLLRFWANGPLQWWHPDGTVETPPPASHGLSAWEAQCARLRYGERLTPARIAERTGRTSASVNAALNRGRAKSDTRWLTYREVRRRLTAMGLV